MYIMDQTTANEIAQKTHMKYPEMRRIFQATEEEADKWEMESRKIVEEQSDSEVARAVVIYCPLFGEPSNNGVLPETSGNEKPTSGDTDGRGNGIDCPDGHKTGRTTDGAGNKNNTELPETFKQRTERNDLTLVDRGSAEGGGVGGAESSETSPGEPTGTTKPTNGVETLSGDTGTFAKNIF